MGGHAHRPREPIRAAVAILTVSDTRTPEDDLSGETSQAMLEAAGHRVVETRIVPDEPEQVAECLRDWLARRDVEAIVLTGGTGISARDRTYEAVDAMLEKRIDGFGEIFRALSFAQIGSAAMLSRAVGGIASGKPVFSLPGSPKAVALGLERLILPELGHLLAELRKQSPGGG